MKDLLSIRSAAEKIRALRDSGKTAVFTNGCFDILHIGHLRYLADAKSRGDCLIVGLNSDNSVRRLKGPDRPVNPENERAEMLLSLKSVDYVVIFDEDTPYELIAEIKPDVLVKGGDWAVEEIVGADIVLALGGRVMSLPFVEGRSTTAIIQRILKKGREE